MRHIRRATVFLVLTTLFHIPVACAWIYVDDTEERVLQELGKPVGIFEMGDQKIFSYKGGEVTIQNGKVIEVDLVSQNDQEPPPKPAPAPPPHEPPTISPPVTVEKTNPASHPAQSGPKELIVRGVKMRPGLSSETLLIETADSYIRDLFLAERFNELEEISVALNHTDARTSTGTWKITNYFHGIRDALGDKPDGYEKKLNIIRRWQAAFPSSMTARIAEAKALTDIAWDARGSGYANTVTEDGWKSFHALLDAAHKVLIEAATLPGTNPEYYLCLMQIALGQGMERNEFEKIFQDGVRQWPSYIPFYEMKAYYLMPRWHGRKGEMEKFFHEVYEKHPEGKLIYTKICQDQEGYYGSSFFKETDFKWKLLKEAYEDTLKKYPDSNLNLNYYAYMACLAEDNKTAKKLLQKIEGKYEDRVWRGKSGMEYYARLRRFYKIGR